MDRVAQFANVVDTAVRRGVDLVEVEIGRTDRAREDACERGLSRTARTGEKECVRYLSFLDGALKHGDDVILVAYLLERGWAVLPIERGRGVGHDD